MGLSSIFSKVLGLVLALWVGLAYGGSALAQSAASDPAIFSPGDIQTITELKQSAFAASQAGQFAAAEDLWSELIEYLPDEPAVWSNRGNTRVSQNKLTEALADYTQAIELAPNEPDPYLNRGAALEGLGRWEDAIADYTHLLTINSKDAAAYNNRGNARAGLGQWEAALKDYREAVTLDPQFSFARINEALALYQIGETDQAIRQFRGLSRKYPNFPDARAALTAALWEAGQRGEAESNWVAVVGLDGRYKDLDWVRTVRRWPPAMVAALEKFLNL
ncbi:tetratricopeptide repeat protein [Pseudanabaena sp. FACHB-2040]|uniref:tetratricopeptide repeat protein n=1 Tax=Pseudanabaena sp. FACHB-2040 TaxID=2692859 RepID=UPI0016876FBB|nr:tetratricopeptide repeat protein [Pseudanabaena sp. FACHB-2040]MBD2260989.1 tetratricopeptide repeat protein [Pseudanabaena sp. FACHB-2040]